MQDIPSIDMKKINYYSKTAKTNARLLSGFLLFIGLINTLSASETSLPATDVQFTETPAAINPGMYTGISADSKMVVTLKDGSYETISLPYRVLYRPGENIGAQIAGTVVDKNGKAIKQAKDRKFNMAAAGPFFATAPGSASLLAVGNPEQLVLISQYETHRESQSKASHILDLKQQLPMPLEAIEINLEEPNKSLSSTDLREIETDKVNGLWMPTAGIKTSWNTHLGQELNEPDAAYYVNHPLEPMNLYLRTTGKKPAGGGANPYHYGFAFEVKHKAGSINFDLVKQYSMGRTGGASILPMEDERTVYIGDGVNAGGFYMYVADEQKNLSAGTLYAAKWKHITKAKDGVAILSWVRLGHASNTDIESLLKRGIKFDDIFESVNSKTYQEHPDKYQDYKAVTVQSGYRPADTKALNNSYLKLKPGMEKAAAILETRRYAAYLGATTEFSPIKGMAFQKVNDKKQFVYLSMSEIGEAMQGKSSVKNENDHIKLGGKAQDFACGAIYKMRLMDVAVDTKVDPINSQYAVGTITTVLAGAKKPDWQTTEYAQHDQCDTDRIANPGNLVYSPDLKTLFIAENGDKHINNALWAYNVNNRQLVRLLQAPATARLSGLQLHTVNNNAYLFLSMQQPAAYEDLAQYPGELKGFLRRRTDKRAAVGYIGPFPAVNITGEDEAMNGIAAATQK